MNDEPVEIDINLRQNVDTEADKATDAIKRLSAESARLQEDTTKMIGVQQAVVTKLKTEIESLQNAFTNISIDTGDEKAVKWRQETYQQIRALNVELVNQEGILAELETRNNTLTTSKSKLLGEMEAANTAMNNLTLQGKAESDQYKELEAQLYSMGDAYLALNAEHEKIGDARVNLESFAEGLDGVSGSIQTGMEQFGSASEKTEEFAESLKTVEKAQTVVEAGQKAVNETVVETAEKSKKAANETKQWSALNQLLAKTFNISNAAAQKLIATVSLGLGIAISAITALVNKQIDKWKEARRELEEYKQSVASNAASQIANYEKLRSSYNRLGDDIKSKEQFIRDNQDAFKQLGVSINDVNDADSAFIHNTEAFKEAIRQRAIATAAMELAAEQYKKMLIERQKTQEKIDKAMAKSQAIVAATETNTGMSVDNATSGFNPQIKVIPGLTPVTEIEAKKEVDSYLSDAERKYGKAGDDWIKKNVEADDASKRILDGLGLSPIKTKKEKEEKSKKEKTKKDDGTEKLLKLETDIQKDIDANVVAAMEEGRDKKLAVIDADFNARKTLIASRLAEIEKIEKETGVDATEQKNLLSALDASETAKYEAQRKAVEEGSRKAIDEVWRDIDARFQTENERRLSDIDNFYRETTQKAKENGATQAELDAISVSHARDTEIEKQQIALETLDFDTQIALRRAAIQDRRVLLETDREEKILKIQLDAAKKRLEKLKGLEKDGAASAKDIEAATVEVEELSAALENLPAKKIQEVTGYITQSIEGIGDFASAFDDDLGDLTDILGSAASGIANLGMGIMTGNPQQIIQGSVELLKTAGKIINANKEANAEIRQFGIELAQQAIDYSIAVIRALKDIKSETDSIFIDDYSNSLTQGMKGYNSAIEKQAELMAKLSDATVKTGVQKKKFLGITYGTKDVYGNLLANYKKLLNTDDELIDKNGKINRELAETLLQSGKLNDETTKLVEQILSISDAAEEAMAAVESVLSDMVGDLGTQLKSALDDAFASGTDSAAAMKDNVIAMMKDIATQKLFSAVFGSLFSELEDRMKKSYGATGDNDLTDDLDWFMKNYPQLVDSYNAGLSDLQQRIKDAYGVDPFADAGGRTAVNKGIAQASQDSIDELNGRITFLVMKVDGIGTINASMLDMDREQLLTQRAMLGYLETIAENSEFLRKLATIDENIDRMVREGMRMKN